MKFLGFQEIFAFLSHFSLKFVFFYFAGWGGGSNKFTDVGGQGRILAWCGRG